MRLAPSSTPSRRRTSIASYRAEASFYQSLAASATLRDMAPRCYWVHADDRLSSSLPNRPSSANDASPTTKEAEDAAIRALRESCFMMITGDVRAVFPSVTASMRRARGAHDQMRGAASASCSRCVSATTHELSGGGVPYEPRSQYRGYVLDVCLSFEVDHINARHSRLRRDAAAYIPAVTAMTTSEEPVR